MDEDFESFAIVDSDEEPAPKPRITLKLPSLKALKAQKPAKPPRAVKLKPLKEVLTRLIAQIKKKDDYAFFLHPVDVSEVPGYTAVVKRPMDFGTMSNKVARGKYRSLEDFTSDVRLVTANAKAFNQPGTIYHTEADKIEVWALDLIARASSTVIQYETDWNIDVEGDGDAEINVDEEDDTAMDVDDPGPSRRSHSVVSAAGGNEGLSTRRSTRGPYKKRQPVETKNAPPETADADGRLPGAKDGLGVFPPGSDMARTMLALKQKGKRYKTKKERLRFEKEGPPFHPDGSLDYWEMEDPYSILSSLAPESSTRPHMTLLYPPPPPPPPPHSEQHSLAPSQTQHPHIGVVTLPVDASSYAPPAVPLRKHWTIQRNYSRVKKEEEKPREYHHREVHAVDWGSLGVLGGQLSEERNRRGIADELVPELLRGQLDVDEQTKKRKRDDDDVYFNSQRAAEAEMHLRDVVYGGTDGYAYVRSLAQFLTRPRTTVPSNSDLELGMPLAQWVEKHIVEPLTEGHHTILKETSRIIAQRGDERTNPTASSSVPLIVKREPLEDSAHSMDEQLRAHIRTSEYFRPLLDLRTEQIDMGSLIRDPEEVFRSDEEWEGKRFKKMASVPALRLETPEELTHVLEFVTAALKRVAGTETAQGETAEMRDIRMNLLALSKRVSVDLIKPVPEELLPESLKGTIPIAK